MKRLRINEDTRPLSEFRTGIASFLKKTHDTKRPLVITQHGKGVAVLLGVDEYESMQAQDNITAAENWVDTVFAKVEHLKSLPESGRIVPEINNRK